MATDPRPTRLTLAARNTTPSPAPMPLSEFLADQRATYTITQAAALLGVSRSTAYECVHTGQLPVLRHGRR